MSSSMITSYMGAQLPVLLSIDLTTFLVEMHHFSGAAAPYLQ